MSRNHVSALAYATLSWILFAGCGPAAAPAVATGKPSAVAETRREKRELPTEATAYWARPIKTYSLSPDPGLFAAARGYKGLVAIFDEALPEESREAVTHLRPLDAVAVVYNHYFEKYDGSPPTPLSWWVQYKLGIPSHVVMFDGHAVATAEGPGAAAELDEALRKTAREFDRKHGFWGYGVAREEYEPGRLRQTVVFSEKRLLLEDFPKFYEPGSTFRLKGRVLGQDRRLRVEVGSRGGDITRDLQVDDQGNFSVEIRLPLRKGIGKVFIERPKTATVPGLGFLFLDIYIGVPEPAVPDQDDFFNAGVPPQHMCANFKPVPPADGAGDLPEQPSYVEQEAALAAVAEKIKACNGSEGGEISMTFDIDGSGQVRSAGAFGVLNGTSLDLCVSRALCEARFPPFKRKSLILLMGIEL